MDRFVHQHFVHNENLEHLRDLLRRTTDEAKCQRIVKLIEEEAKKAER